MPSAARPAHVELGAALYFDGHFVIIDPGCATKVCPLSSPVTISSRPTVKVGGTLPL
jgi:hypothetical protein